jgi:hypothetical protein
VQQKISGFAKNSSNKIGFPALGYLGVADEPESERGKWARAIFQWFAPEDAMARRLQIVRDGCGQVMAQEVTSIVCRLFQNFMEL